MIIQKQIIVGIKNNINKFKCKIKHKYKQTKIHKIIETKDKTVLQPMYIQICQRCRHIKE